MSAVLSSVFGAGAQLFNNAGVVLAGGQLFTYLAGTTTLAPTYTSSFQTVQNANPIILDSAGRIPNEVWIPNGVQYKFVVQDAYSNTLSTYDNIPGINQTTATLSEWATGYTPTYVGATTFTVPGNLVGVYQVGRRVQFVVTSGTYYGTIATTNYNGTSATTVVITPDSTAMDSSLSAVNYGFMSATNFSVPDIFVGANNTALTGVPTAPTAALGTSTTQLATTAFAQNMQSPTFSGTPTAPTAAPGTNTTQLATTAFVAAQAFSSALPAQTGNAGKWLSTDGTVASWNAIGASGVTSVGITAPAMFTVSNSPVTTTGNLVLTYSGVALPASSGGTSFASYTIGDILYASGTAALSRLAAVATGSVLLAGGVGSAPSWGPVPLATAVAGVLAGTNGGTGVNNAARTITYAGNVTFTGAFNVSFSIPGAYTYTFPGGTATLAAISGNTFTGDQNLNNNNLVGAKMVGFYGEYNNGNSSTAVTITLANGLKQKVTLTGNATITINTTNALVGSYQLRIIQDGTGGRTVAWSGLSASRWLGSVSAPAPNTAIGGESIVAMFFDGANITQSMSKVGAV